MLNRLAKLHFFPSFSSLSQFKIIFQFEFPAKPKNSPILQKPVLPVRTPWSKKVEFGGNLAKISPQFLRMEREDVIPFWKIWTVIAKNVFLNYSKNLKMDVAVCFGHFPTLFFKKVNHDFF